MIMEIHNPVADEELAYVKHIASDIVDVGLLRCFPGDPYDGPAAYPVTDPHVRRGISPARWFIRATWDRTRTVNYTLPSLVLLQDATHWLNTRTPPPMRVLFPSPCTGP